MRRRTFKINMGIIQISSLLCILINLNNAQIIDLGHDLSNETLVYPLPAYLENPFRLKVEAKGKLLQDKYWLAFNSFSSTEHIGTVVEAPYFLNEFGWTVEQIPVERFIAPVSVIDVREKGEETPNYEISAQDIQDWISQYGLFPNNSIILAYTGWGAKYGDATAYFGHPSDISKFNSPGFSVDAVQAVNDLRQSHDIHIHAFGIDTISFDPGNSTDYPAHRLALSENQYVIESLHNLDKLPPTGATIIVMPMKIKGGSGAPSRVMAQLPFNSETPRIVKPYFIN